MPGHVGQPLGLHLVDGLAGEADPGGRQVAEAADLAAAGREGVLPALGAVHGRRARALGVGPARRLAVQLAPPGQEGGVGEVVAPGRRPARPPSGTPASGRAACAAVRASVVRSTSASAPSASESTTITCPGVARSSTSASASAGLGRAEVAHRGRSGRGPARPWRTPSAGRDGLDGPDVQPGHDGVVDVALGEAGVLQRVGEGLAGQRARRAPRRSAPPRRASRSRPGTRQRSRNSSLAAPRPISSATAPSGPQTKATAPSPVSRSSAPPARPVRRSESTASARRGAGAWPSASGQRSPTAERDEPARS